MHHLGYRASFSLLAGKPTRLHAKILKSRSETRKRGAKLIIFSISVIQAIFSNEKRKVEQILGVSCAGAGLSESVIKKS